jgi:protein involved in polysaccharide export with SLBB domain
MKLNLINALKITILCLTIGSDTVLFAQTSAASYFFISKPGELTIQVNIWGSIRIPGRYEVPTSTDLIQLISYAGGPTVDADLDEVRITRVSKNEGNNDIREQYYVDLDDFSSVDNAKLTLYPGDTIFINRTAWSSLRDIFTVVSTAAIVTTAVANIIIASNRR